MTRTAERFAAVRLAALDMRHTARKAEMYPTDENIASDMAALDRFATELTELEMEVA